LQWFRIATALVQDSYCIGSGYLLQWFRIAIAVVQDSYCNGSG